MPTYNTSSLLYLIFFECSGVFEIFLDAILTTNFLNTLHQSLHTWYTNVALVFLWYCVVFVVAAIVGSVVFVIVLILLEVLALDSSQTHMGYLHLVRTSTRFFCSILSISYFE